MSLLEVSDVTVRFGGHTALSSVSLSAEAGRITGLIGPNGAGKTTMFNVITGQLDPTRGSVSLEGKDIGKLLPYKRARLGMARTSATSVRPTRASSSSTVGGGPSAPPLLRPHCLRRPPATWMFSRTVSEENSAPC
jgi:ABC-type branched-subunit amino acid transport system ATPase component